jgi:LacI family transcriptional regulator
MGASIKDVAERAGVFTATVSHVLNGTRKTRPVTQQKVMTAVRELRYSQNQAARNLARGRSSLLGLIISDLPSPFFPEITSAFQEHALRHNLDAVVLNTNYDPQRTLNAVKRLIGLQVPGVAVLTSQIDPNVRRLLVESNIAALYLDLGRVDKLVSNILLDYEHGIVEALEHLTGMGHRRIAYIGGPLHLHSAQQRKRAFAESARRLGLEPPQMADSDFTVKGGYFAASKLLGSHSPSAVIAGNDLTAIGVLHAAYDAKLQVPGDLSVLGFDDISFAEYSQPALTTVSVPRAEIG